MLRIERGAGSEETNARLTAEEPSAELPTAADLRVSVEPLPETFALGKSAPNPASRRATTEYALPKQAEVTITLYDVLGRWVATLVDGLWLGEIELHEDKIVISGWTWTGPVEKETPLNDTTTFEKWTVQEGPNFRLHFGEGNSVFGRIEKGAGLWELELEDDERVKVKQRH